MKLLWEWNLEDSLGKNNYHQNYEICLFCLIFHTFLRIQHILLNFQELRSSLDNFLVGRKGDSLNFLVFIAFIWPPTAYLSVVTYYDMKHICRLRRIGVHQHKAPRFLQWRSQHRFNAQISWSWNRYQNGELCFIVMYP